MQEEWTDPHVPIALACSVYMDAMAGFAKDAHCGYIEMPCAVPWQ